MLEDEREIKQTSISSTTPLIYCLEFLSIIEFSFKVQSHHQKRYTTGICDTSFAMNEKCSVLQNIVVTNKVDKKLGGSWK